MTFEWDENKNQSEMKISGLLEPVIGEKEGIGMKKKIVYTESPKNVSKTLYESERVIDFLPPPEKLIRKEPKVKITITLNSGSIDFFKKNARKNNVKY